MRVPDGIQYQMLPPTQYSKYVVLQGLLQTLKTAIPSSNQSVSQSGKSLDPVPQSLLDAVQSAQDFSQTRLITMDLSDLAPDQRAQIQGVHTEISKQFRLLGMDISFLLVARSSATQQEKQAQIRDRVERLCRYCEILLEEGDMPA